MFRVAESRNGNRIRAFLEIQSLCSYAVSFSTARGRCLSPVNLMSCTSSLSYLRRVSKMSNLGLDAGEDFYTEAAERAEKTEWVRQMMEEFLQGTRGIRSGLSVRAATA